MLAHAFILLVLNYMIELTTGIVFLLSSMYGSGNLPTDAINALGHVDSSDDSAQIIATTDRKSLEKYLREHFADTPILVEIARCESTFTHYNKDGDIMRGKVNKADVGVMQINEKYHLETAVKLGYDIHTIEGNVAYAKYLYKKFGSQPWKASAPCWGSKEVAMNN